ncbi:hypothetical protein SAMN02745248_01062 [Hathewaya proteolytica DSM 3090]|uniref:Uncharacterized protein n=1 Tax=Hathewaya proteolytica DSM 3090 TaxID=1121331 RepID=A0A1M6MHM3_9CLOT|nr:hypothetical protein [Hathewaya proteolytica]SHJ82957.1 hypothetical protein SAMN02745248_01062 [Hathewaya proteolytica DSM 3090]
MKKIIGVLVCCFLILFCFYPFHAFATELDYASKKIGDISITVKTPDTKKPVSGFNVYIYKIATVENSPNGMKYKITGDFKNAGLDPGSDNDQWQSMAKALTEYADINKVEPIKLLTNESGKATLKSCNLGVYLVTFDKIMPKELPYSGINPFVLSIPYTSEDGRTLIYKVEAFPKVEVTIEEPNNPYDPNDDIDKDKDKDDFPTDDNPDPDHTPDPKLPQTGILKWPIPVLAVSGVLIFSLGWADVFLRRKK